MDVEGILGRFKEKGWYMPRVKKLVEEYQNIELNEHMKKIDDEPVKRLCQVLNDNDYETIDSCDGHGKILPMIFFFCDEQNHMRDLTWLLSNQTTTNFNWVFKTYAENPSLNPDCPLMYVLKPESYVNPNGNYHKLKQDFDIIGIHVMKYFNPKTTQ